MTGWTTHTYEAEGVRMRYYIAGEGKPLLLLHGGGVHATLYRATINLFAEKFLVIAPDIPPFGASSMPPKLWNGVKYGQFFAAFIAGREWEDVTVVGHSFGGTVALCLAAATSRVERLVLVDAAGVSLPTLLRFVYQFWVEKTHHNMRQEVRTTLAMEQAFMLNIIRKLPWLWRGMKIVTRTLTPQYETEIRRIAARTLILWGTQDELFPLRDAQYLHTHISGSIVKEIPGNHDWCLFRPEWLYEYVKRFVYG